jgi:hypothetical protein
MMRDRDDHAYRFTRGEPHRIPPRFSGLKSHPHRDAPSIAPSSGLQKFVPWTVKSEVYSEQIGGNLFRADGGNSFGPNGFSIGSSRHV